LLLDSSSFGAGERFSPRPKIAFLNEEKGSEKERKNIIAGGDLAVAVVSYARSRRRGSKTLTVEISTSLFGSKRLKKEGVLRPSGGRKIKGCYSLGAFVNPLAEEVWLFEGRLPLGGAKAGGGTMRRYRTIWDMQEEGRGLPFWGGPKLKGEKRDQKRKFENDKFRMYRHGDGRFKWGGGP